MHISGSQLAPLGLKLDLSPALLRWMNDQLQRQEASSQLGGPSTSAERFGLATRQTPNTALTFCGERAGLRDTRRANSSASSDLKSEAILPPSCPVRVNANQVVTGEWEVRPS